MYKVDYFDSTGRKQGHIEFQTEQLPEKPNKRFLHQMAVLYENNLRSGTAHTKGRAEVEGSNRKPWRQKGLGRARAGTIRSPIWRHGGVVFGPTYRNRTIKIPSKMKRSATKHALVGKLSDNEVKVIENLLVERPKTKEVYTVLNEMGLTGKMLFVTKDYDKNLFLSARNIPTVSLLPSNQVNSYELLKHKYCVMTLSAFETVFGVTKDKVSIVKEPVSVSPKKEVKKEQDAKSAEAEVIKTKGKKTQAKPKGKAKDARKKK